VGVETFLRLGEIQARLAQIGYDYDPAASTSEPNRHVFRKGPAASEQLRTHHLHLALINGPPWVRLLAFRDHLRAFPDVASQYEKMKTELARKFEDDGDSYTREKGAFVRRVEDIALARTRIND